jgi:hypothetical protein
MRIRGRYSSAKETILERDTYELIQVLLSDEPTAIHQFKITPLLNDILRTGVVPPVPHPAESYIVAKKSNPAGSVRGKV